MSASGETHGLKKMLDYPSRELGYFHTKEDLQHYEDTTLLGRNYFSVPACGRLNTIQGARHLHIVLRWSHYSSTVKGRLSVLSVKSATLRCQ